jgi:hypothetical protein
MSTEPPGDSDPVLYRLDPEIIQRRLGVLMRTYVHTRSVTVARVVVRHLEGLCAHPHFQADSEERCAYRRLAREWRLLAGMA